MTSDMWTMLDDIARAVDRDEMHAAFTARFERCAFWPLHFPLPCSVTLVTALFGFRLL